MNPYQILSEARALLSDPNHWTTDVLANDAGNRFCLMGALSKVATGNPYQLDDATRVARNLLRENIVSDDITPSIAKFNDENGHAAVIALLDKTLHNALVPA